jgi:hypothetical protein
VFGNEQKSAAEQRKTLSGLKTKRRRADMKSPHMLLLLGAAILWASHCRAQAVPDAKTAYQQARDTAETTFKNARARCDSIAGNPHDVCVAEAKAARVQADEEAGAAYENTLAAYTRARMRIASANYDRDKARCDGLTGNNKDVCMAQAKAALIAAQADAKADKKAIEARSEAREDKQKAAYKVALEKCDAYAGAVKDRCVTQAKAAYALP